MFLADAFGMIQSFFAKLTDAKSEKENESDRMRAQAPAQVAWPGFSSRLRHLTNVLMKERLELYHGRAGAMERKAVTRLQRRGMGRATCS